MLRGKFDRGEETERDRDTDHGQPLAINYKSGSLEWVGSGLP